MLPDFTPTFCCASLAMSFASVVRVAATVCRRVRLMVVGSHVVGSHTAHVHVRVLCM